jgi:hypothetical protein
MFDETPGISVLSFRFRKTGFLLLKNAITKRKWVCYGVPRQTLAQNTMTLGAGLNWLLVTIHAAMPRTMAKFGALIVHLLPSHPIYLFFLLVKLVNDRWTWRNLQAGWIELKRPGFSRQRAFESRGPNKMGIKFARHIISPFTVR